MNSFLLYISQKIIHILPDARLFGLKRSLLRLAGAKIGKNVRICSSVRIIGNSFLEIGDNTWIGHGTWIFCSAPIRIGQNVNVAPLCYLGTGTHEVDRCGESIAGTGRSMPIEIGDGSWLCARATVIAGVSIGEKSIVAAGAVVLKSIPNNSFVGGVPAKEIE